MTQKTSLFKGQKKKEAPANRHGKALNAKKGSLVKPPNKKGAAYEQGKEVTRFINANNEARTAAVAAKDGAQFKVFKAPEGSDGVSGKKGKEPLAPKGGMIMGRRAKGTTPKGKK
eukprot:TRINITY_DN1610_c0_g4_i1.p2 TRINITY_DN1610_c0_g4~~TRINITY_DN1610_c0_g4_i1.p2  ORF type:complete len:115 (+),score=34.22 TRINITY_DN1610_c0_g4_i1:251-595(+)